MGKRKRKTIDYLDTRVNESRVKDSIEHKLFFKICFPLQFFYVWFYPLILKGYRKILTMEDLPRLHKTYRSDYYIKTFDSVWKKFECPIIKKVRLILTIYICFGFPYILAGIFQVIYTALQVFYPKFLEMLLLSFNPRMTSEESDRFSLYRQILPDELRPPEDITTVGYRKDESNGWVWLLALVISIAFSAIFHQFCIFLSAKVGLKIRSVLTAKIYHKTLKLSNKARTKHEDGRILNYISTDCSKLDHYHQHFHDSWSCLLIVIICFYFIVRLIDYGVLASIALTLLMIPGCIILGLVFWKLRKTHLFTTDKRLSRMNEVFQGISIIKCFTWESSYMKIINKVRDKEIWLIRFAFMFATCFKCIILCMPNLMTAAGFFTYYFVHKELDAVTIFTTIVYFNVIRTPLINLPVVLTRFVEGFVSYMRIQNFLEAEERDERVDFGNPDVPIRIKDGHFEWEEPRSKKKKKKKKEKEKVEDDEEDESEIPEEDSDLSEEELMDIKKKKNKKKKMEEEEDDDDEDDSVEHSEEDDESSDTRRRKRKERKKKDKERKEKLKDTVGKLKNINIQIEKGELVMIVGETGSGKSSLFSSILGEMKKLGGVVEVSGNICYCDQTPFILNGTMRDNILFGKPLNRKLLDTVLEVCRLDKDLNEDYFEGGELVEIGEKGVNLSGGQKYRVSLARACYFGGDLYLLDDPLAAVDSACGKHIFERCIEEFLREKTRVVISHQLNYCQKADRIIYMKHGEIVEHGSYDDLMDRGEEFSKLVNEYFEEGETTSTVSTISNINELIFDSEENDSDDFDYNDIPPGIEIIREDNNNNNNNLNISNNNNVVGQTEEIIDISEDGDFGEKGVQTNHIELRELFIVNEKDLKKKSPTRLILQEERLVGSLPLRVVYSYLSAMPGGIWIFGVICLCYVVTELCFLGADTFLVQFSAQNTYLDQNVNVPFMMNMNNESSFYPYHCNLEDPNIRYCEEKEFKIDWMKYEIGFDLDDHEITYSKIDSRQNVVLLGIYGGFSVLIITALIIVSIITLNLLLCSSQSIFRKVLRRLVFATTGFFDSQPIGRIISRLSGDVQLLDWDLNFGIDIFLALFAAVIGACGMIAYITKGMFIPFILIIGILYFFIFQFYRRTSRELKRLNSVSRSPLVSSVGETLTGLSTIRAYSYEGFFKSKNHRYIDLLNRSQYLLISANRWLEVTLNIIGSWIIGAAGLCSLCIAYFDIFEPIRPSPSFLSLCVTDAIIISTLLSAIVFVLTNIEIQMNAVERLEHYLQFVPQEGQQKKKKKKNKNKNKNDSSSSSSDDDDSDLDSDLDSESSVDLDLDSEEEVMKELKRKREKIEGRYKKEEFNRYKLDFNTKERLAWVRHGRIEFKNFHMKYRKNTRMVLRDVSFVIHPKERIGIIGDTGSGKTSLMNSILRFIESSGGKIMIDGLDISKIPLLVLRREISIIPQEPVLFKGTIRSNLDPFNVYKDEELLQALRKSNLSTFVEIKLPKGLRTKVEEGGRNFSKGERQLFCMARAILKKTKILIMDECTANVDFETDQFIQRTIREEFSKNCTVLTIAHRLQTVLDYDRILVMRNGRVAEFDTPYKLIKRQEKSQFYNLLIENPNPGVLLSQVIENKKTMPVKRRFVDWELTGDEIFTEIAKYKKRNAVKDKSCLSYLGLK